jgi:hypothetical protein
MFVNIDIEIGKGNYGAVAIRLRGAQGSGVQESVIKVGEGLAGIEGGAGSGGSHYKVTVIGGKIGLDLSQSENAPTITGISLINQRRTAIFYGGQQSLCGVGIDIRTRIKGPVILGGPKKRFPHHGQITLVDSVIRFEGPPGTAISSASSLYLNNVYIKCAKWAVSNLDRSFLEGNSKGWVHIKEYAHGVDPKYWRRYQYRAPVYIDGKRFKKDITDLEENIKPPSNLQSKHVWKDEFPGFESTGAVNVKAPPYNAKGDSITDDTGAIQNAIDDNEIVFLPKGYYRVNQTIKLKPNTKLVGVARHLSIIMIREGRRYFRNNVESKPIVQTSNEANAKTVLAFCTIFVPRGLNGAFALDWQSGRYSIFRAVNFSARKIYGYNDKTNPPRRNTPFVVISKNGGGRWYNFNFGDYLYHGPNYRHLIIKGTREPLRFYQCDPEHSRGEANLEIQNSMNIDIFGLKGEGNFPILLVKNSENIRIFGYGGNAAAFKGDSLFRFENSRFYLLANVVDSPRLQGVGSDDYFAGKGVDPKKWYLITEMNSTGAYQKTKPLDRPVLFKRLESIN